MSSEENLASQPTEEELEQRERAYRFHLSEIFHQLLQSERFMRFYKANYDVQQYVDKVNETIEIRVIERPPELALQELQNIAREHAMEHMPLVETATLQDLAELDKDRK